MSNHRYFHEKCRRSSNSRNPQTISECSNDQRTPIRKKLEEIVRNHIYRRDSKDVPEAFVQIKVSARILSRDRSTDTSSVIDRTKTRLSRISRTDHRFKIHGLKIHAESDPRARSKKEKKKVVGMDNFHQVDTKKRGKKPRRGEERIARKTQPEERPEEKQTSDRGGKTGDARWWRAIAMNRQTRWCVASSRSEARAELVAARIGELAGRCSGYQRRQIRQTEGRERFDVTG